MKIDIYEYSSIGTSAENQDSHTFGPLGENGFYAMIADGLGGHGGGREASLTALKTFEGCVGDKLPSAQEITAWTAKANDEIISRRKDANDMKTTIVCLFIQNGKAVWAHIGDSRLYHFYEGQLADYTNDHSVCQLAVKMGEITRNQIQGHKDRSKLLKVLGSDVSKPEIAPEITLKKGRHSFLLCSDGLWERLFEDEIMLDLYKSDTAEQWVTFLRKRAEKRQHQNVDNNTAIAIMLDI